MQFAFESYAVWALGIPVVAGVLWLVLRRSELTVKAWFSPDQYSRSYPRLKFGLRLAGVALLAGALVGPYGSRTELPARRAEREVLYLLDVSASMNVQDLGLSRLDKAREELRRLINALRGDNQGLIVFAETPYMQCPLTRDTETLLALLDLVKTEQFAQTGTQFRPALALALDRFIHGTSRQAARAVVLISDGEDFGDSYASLVERLRQADIALIAVGVGTTAGGAVPEPGGLQEMRLKRRPDGEAVLSQLQDAPLQSLSDAFGTPYVRLASQEASMIPALEQLSAMRPYRGSQELAAIPGNRYQALLFPAIMCLFASLFLMPVRKI